MTPAESQQLAELVERFLNEPTETDVRQLEQLLLSSEEAREIYLDLTHQHATLRQLGDVLVDAQLQGHSVAGAVASTVANQSGTDGPPGTMPMAGWLQLPLVLLSAVILAAAGWAMFAQPTDESAPQIATLLSSEHATWEGSLPTQPGAQLTSGFLQLKTGVATIRFRSGAELVMEAPAHLVLVSEMQARLKSGSAIVTVPESAVGFVVDTPDAKATDYGTQFAIAVDQQGRSAFEVLSGEIAVQHTASGQSLRLRDSGVAQVTDGGLESINGPLSEGTVQPTERHIRLQCDQRATSILRNNARATHLHPDMLMVKTCVADSSYDRRALFSFSLKPVQDLDSLGSATLRLNLVPSGLGFAARLAEQNTFAVYGLRNESLESWSTDELQWEDAPPLDEYTLLGRFVVPRGRQWGAVRVSTPELLRFVQQDRSGEVSILVVRETIERQQAGLVHAFAGPSHPEASGPSLVLGE